MGSVIQTWNFLLVCVSLLCDIPLAPPIILLRILIGKYRIYPNQCDVIATNCLCKSAFEVMIMTWMNDAAIGPVRHSQKSLDGEYIVLIVLQGCTDLTLVIIHTYARRLEEFRSLHHES